MVLKIKNTFTLALATVAAFGFVAHTAVAVPAPIGPVEDEIIQAEPSPTEDGVCPRPDDATINAAMSLFGEFEISDGDACAMEAAACPAQSPLTAEGKKILLAIEAAFNGSPTVGTSDTSFVTFQDPQAGQKKDEFNYYDIPYGPDGRPDINVIWELLHKAYGLPYVKGKIHPSLAYYVNCDNYAWGGWLNNNCKHMSAVIVAGLQARGVYCGQAAMFKHVCGEFYAKPPPKFAAKCSGWWIIDWYGELRPVTNEQLVLLNGQLVAPPVWGISPKAPKLTICPGYGLEDAPKDPTGGETPGGTVQPKVPPHPSRKPRR